MGIFNSFFGSNKKSQTDQLENKKNDWKETKVDNSEKSRLTTEEIQRIKDFETQWGEKVKESRHIKIPSLGKRKNGIVEDLILQRGIRSLKPDDKGLYNIKENSLKKKMLEIESSLIDKFLLDNQYFISGNKKLYFLNEKERNTLFTHYQIKYGSNSFKKRFDINIDTGLDFISIDKKIVSLNKDLYFLDWTSKVYFGFDIDIDTKWESKYGRDEILNRTYYRHNIFCLPSSISSSIIDDLYYPVIEFNDLDYFPSKWTKDNTFMNCMTTLLSFNFRNKLITRTEEFYRFIEFEKELKEIKEKNEVKEKVKKTYSVFDKNGNDKLDVTETNGYVELLNQMKDELQEKGGDHVQELIKLKKFTQEKRENLNSLFEILKSVETHRDFNFYVDVLKNEINVYQKFVFHSMSMITFLIDGDKFSFYEIYELFDELNVFDSKWERDLSEKLNTINTSINESSKSIENTLKDINNSIYSHSIQINNKLDKLTYTTESSIKTLTNIMNTRLKSINSSIDTNNLLTLINTYQVYKINKNTKSLNP